jgi:hypothetical protein
MIPIDQDHWKTFSKRERKEILTNPHHWSMVHAFVFDNEANQFLDARGYHSSLRAVLNFWGTGGEKESGGRDLKYPISQNDIRQMSLGTDDEMEDLDLSNNALRKALSYAQRKLGVDISNSEKQLKSRKAPVRKPYRDTSVYHSDEEIPSSDEEWPEEWPEEN